MVAAPALDTPDGLWWTTHGDIDQPALDEFDVPPQMSGEADAASSGYGDLEFTLKGVAISPGSPPYPTTAYLDYEFLMIGEGPVGEGNDEPVEGDDCGE
jgi:hypothetical protein